MDRRMAGPKEEGGVGVVEKTVTKERTKKPKRYKVLLHNDDYTTMEFVVWVLQSVFHHDEGSATEIMLHVHRNGMGVAGVYTREVAEMRVAQVDALAKEHEFPLRTSVEEED
jgi:ATP-dependent Clp protease adaptor protein ClpS